MTIETALYTRENNFMVEEARPNRVSVGYGIKFFEGNPIEDHHHFNSSQVEPQNLRNDIERGVWRAEETLRAADILQSNGKVIIEGAPQSGKGTILYGLSTICDFEGWGYVLVDGHFIDSPADHVVTAIKKADQEGKIVFFDSFDYLFAGNRKMRRLPLEKQKERTKQIIEALQEAEVPLVLTAHGGYWAEMFLNQELMQEHEHFISPIPVYKLPRKIEEKSSQTMFLCAHGFTQEEAQSLVNFGEDPQTIDTLALHFGDYRVTDELQMAISDFAVLKKIARDEGTPERVKNLLQDNTPEAILELTQIFRDYHREVDFLTTLRKTN